MRVRSLVTLAVAGAALAVPSAALAQAGNHKDDDDRDRGRGSFERWGWGWGGDSGSQEQQWTLGTEQVLTGHGLIGGHVQVPAPQPGTTAPAPPVVTVKARGGSLKVLAVSQDVKVDCRGRGYKRERTTYDGHRVISCRGIGGATISGSDWHFRLRVKIGQLKLPAGLQGTLTSWGFWWSGPEIPDDPADLPLA